MWEGEWIALGSALVTADDVEVWRYSVAILVKLATFLGTLHWLAAGGISFVEILILYNFWAGVRLVLENAVPRYRRPGRHFQCRLFRLVQALIFGVRAGSHGRFFARCVLRLVGIGRFMLCDTGANHCRLRHIGWEKCGHGLTCRPRETASEEFLNELPVLFRYPPRSAAALLGGTLNSSILRGEVCW